MLCAALFVLGLCSSGRWNVNYVYMNEFLMEKHIKGVSPFFNATAGLSFIVAALILQLFTKNTICLTYLGACLSMLSLVVALLCLPESAKWLVSQGRMAQAA